MPKKTLIILVIFIHLFYGCTNPDKSASVVTAPTPEPTRISTPTPLYNGAPISVVKEWESFIKDGRYKLASDGYSGKPYHYSWSNDLLAIVEDTKAKNVGSRFKLIYFVENGTTGKFKPNWVLHNLDLSKCTVSNASSALVIYQEGKNTGATLEWDVRRKRYTCLRFR